MENFIFCAVCVYTFKPFVTRAKLPERSAKKEKKVILILIAFDCF